MRHAILITTHNNEEITQHLLKAYDDENIDFYIHVDKKAIHYKYDLIKNVCHKSQVYFVDSLKIYWGTYNQIKSELILLRTAIKKEYDYYHLISGCDIPLFTKQQFLDFFEKNKGKEFVEFSPEEISIENKVIDRVKYYYIFMNSIRSSHAILRKPQTFIRETFLKLQKFLKINRIDNQQFKYGSNWFDITHDFAKYVIASQKWIDKYFKYSCCGDELFLQTLLFNSKFSKDNYYDLPKEERKIQLGRYVDWERGNPYTFVEEDYEEIVNIHSSFFIRKFDYSKDSKIVDKLFQNLEGSEIYEI